MTVDFLDTLRRSELLSPEDIAEIVRQEHFTAESDPKSIAKAFINNQQLTLFQANQLLHGQSRGFFVDQFKLREILGTGGMGWVYIAEPREPHAGAPRQRVAIKLLSDRIKHDVGLRARFELEARAGLQLHHENIVQTLKYGQSDDLYGEVPFMVMEFVEGINLQDLMRLRRGPLPWQQAADCVRQAADGLQHAHERMVHRDIKPTNLLITKNGQVKILDFGLALLQNDDQSEFSLAMIFGHQCLGTDDYIAPEQTFNSHTVDGRADIYSLGCTFYHILTGSPPYPLARTPQKIEAHRFTQFPAIRDKVPEVPEELARILAKMVTKLPDERYATAAEASAALAPFCQRQEVEFDFGEILKMRAAEARKRLQAARPSSRSNTSSTALKPSGVSLPLMPQGIVETRIPADTTPRKSGVALPQPTDGDQVDVQHEGFGGPSPSPDYRQLKPVEDVRLLLVPVPDGPPIRLDRQRMVIGRTSDCPIRLDSPRVSSKHALLSLEGHWWRISDLKSRNGVRVNGVPTTDQLLWPGDRISVADQFHFVLKEIPKPQFWRWWSIALVILSFTALIVAVLYYLLSPAA